MRRYITVISQEMTARNENNIVRLSGSARKALKSDKRELIEVWSKADHASVLLPVAPAYKKDISRAKKSKLRLKDVIFVSSNVANILSTTEGTVWADNKPRKCAIGSDPEIMAIDGDNILYAAHYIGFGGEIGSDGPMLEIRPNPGKTAKDHVDNIREALRCLDFMVKDCMSAATTMKCIPYIEDDRRSYTSGGHIHLGISSYLTQDAIYNYKDPDIFHYALDYVLNLALAIPMQRLDGDLGLRRRLTYGYPGECRLMPDRLEYRTLSSTWLLYPDLAELTLSVAHEITIEFSNLALDYLRNTDMPKTFSFENMAKEILGFSLPSEDDYSKYLLLPNNENITPKVIEDISVPVLQKLINNELLDRFITTTIECNPGSINRNVMTNWRDDVSITTTFKGE